MLKRAAAFLTAALLAIGTAGCYFLPDEEEVLEAPSVKAEEVEYSTVVAKRRDLVKQIINSGKIESSKTKEVSYDTVGGKIKSINISAGDKVEKGDLLCELDTGDLSYQIKDKELRIKKARLNRKILKKNKASQAEIDSAGVDIEILLNEYDELCAQLEDSYLYAPISGTVSSVTELGVGEEIAVGAAVVTIVDTESLYMAIKPDDVDIYKMNQSVVIKYNDKEYKGKVYMIPSQIPDDNKGKYDAESVYIKFTGSKIPSNGIGNIADAVLVLAEAKNVIAVANKMIKTVNGKDIVYILNDNGEREAREVELGLKTGSATEIKSGISEGEKIIAR